MFNIPSFYQENISFDEAVSFFKGTNSQGNLLEALERIDAIWNKHCAQHMVTCVSDDEFFENWSYEVNAYNAVVAGMAPLFAEKK